MKHTRLANSPAGFEHQTFDMKHYTAKHKLIETIYTTKDRVPLRDTQLTEDEQRLNMGTLLLSTDSVDPCYLSLALPVLELSHAQRLDQSFLK